jgi:hypothetical protein
VSNAWHLFNTCLYIYIYIYIYISNLVLHVHNDNYHVVWHNTSTIVFICYEMIMYTFYLGPFFGNKSNNIALWLQYFQMFHTKLICGHFLNHESKIITHLCYNRALQKFAHSFKALHFTFWFPKFTCYKPWHLYFTLPFTKPWSTMCCIYF